MRKFFIVALLFLVVIVSASCVADQLATTTQEGTPKTVASIPMEETYNVAFLLAGKDDQGWNDAHKRGINSLRGLGDVVAESENSFVVVLPDGKMFRVLTVYDVGYDDTGIESQARSVIQQGYEYVFLTWWQAKNTYDKLVQEFPNVLFEHGSGYPVVTSNGTNGSTYFIRIEEGDYVAGCLVGLLGFNEIGFVATNPIPEPVRGVNAFALGVLRCGQEAGFDMSGLVIDVRWIHKWLDRTLERQYAEALLPSYNVIRQLPDTPTVSQVACDAGAVAIGYGTDVSPTAPCALVTNEWVWGSYYQERVLAAINGDWSSHDWWGGFAQDAIRMAGWNPYLSAGVVARVESLVEEIRDGLNPFCGPIDGYGTGPTGSQVDISVPAGQCVGDMGLLTMQWFVNGVRSDFIPAYPKGGHQLFLEPETVNN